MRNERFLYGFCGLIFVIVALQALFPPRAPAMPPPEPKAPIAECKGEAIVVDFPYDGKWTQPHTCKIQCEDKKQHYILYTNGVATPCQDLPGCLDYGEDHGITCTVPLKTTVQ